MLAHLVEVLLGRIVLEPPEREGQVAAHVQDCIDFLHRVVRGKGPVFAFGGPARRCLGGPGFFVEDLYGRIEPGGGFDLAAIAEVQEFGSLAALDDNDGVGLDLPDALPIPPAESSPSPTVRVYGRPFTEARRVSSPTAHPLLRQLGQGLLYVHFPQDALGTRFVLYMQGPLEHQFMAVVAR